MNGYCDWFDVSNYFGWLVWVEDVLLLLLFGEMEKCEGWFIVLEFDRKYGFELYKDLIEGEVVFKCLVLFCFFFDLVVLFEGLLVFKWLEWYIIVVKKSFFVLLIFLFVINN